MTRKQLFFIVAATVGAMVAYLLIVVSLELDTKFKLEDPAASCELRYSFAASLRTYLAVISGLVLFLVAIAVLLAIRFLRKK